MERKPGGHELFSEMFHPAPAVPVRGISVDELRAVCSVVKKFIVRCPDIPCKLLFGVAVIFSVFTDAEMLQPDTKITLPQQKIRCIGFIGPGQVIGVNLLIEVVNPVQIQEIRNLHLLMGPQDFRPQGHHPSAPRTDHFPLVFIEIALQCGPVLPCKVREILLHVSSLIRSVKICSEEKEQIMDSTRIPHDRFGEIVTSNTIERASVNDFRSVLRLPPQNCVASGVKRPDRAGNLQFPVDMRAELPDCLVREGDDKNGFRRNSLSLDQIAHFGRKGRCLPRPGPCDDQHIILIRQDHSALILIERDCRIDRIQDMVEVFFFLRQFFREELLVEFPDDPFRVFPAEKNSPDSLLRPLRSPAFPSAEFREGPGRFQISEKCQCARKFPDPVPVITSGDIVIRVFQLFQKSIEFEQAQCFGVAVAGLFSPGLRMTVAGLPGAVRFLPDGNKHEEAGP